MSLKRQIILLKKAFSASAVRHSCPARPVSAQTAHTTRTVSPVKDWEYHSGNSVSPV